MHVDEGSCAAAVWDGPDASAPAAEAGHWQHTQNFKLAGRRTQASAAHQLLLLARLSLAAALKLGQWLSGGP